MNTVNWKKVKQLSRAHIMEVNTAFSKVNVLFIALFIIVWSLDQIRRYYWKQYRCGTMVCNASYSTSCCSLFVVYEK